MTRTTHRLALVLAIFALALVAFLVGRFVVLAVLSHLLAGDVEQPPAPCSQDQITQTLARASHDVPQLRAARVQRSLCPYAFPGGGAMTLLVIAPDSLTAGIPFRRYDGPIEWGPDAAPSLLPDLFPAGDLSDHLIATDYNGSTSALHLLRPAEGTGPVVLVWMWL